jgi:small GTP-binding protein
MSRILSANTSKRFSIIGKPNKFSAPVPVLEPSAAYAVSSSPIPRQQFDSSSGPPDYHVKIVCVGDGGCGKTCMLVTYSVGKFPTTYVPTVFENYISNVRAPSGKIVELVLWDTAGQEEYDRLRALSYPEVNILLVCFSIDSPSSLDNVYDKWIPEVNHYCPGIPFILVGLKTDLRNDLTTIQHLQSRGQRPITPDEGKAVARKYGAYKYMECSARTKSGLSEIFDTSIAFAVKEQERRTSTTARTPSEDLPRTASRSIPKKKHKRDCIVL